MKKIHLYYSQRILWVTCFKPEPQHLQSLTFQVDPNSIKPPTVSGLLGITMKTNSILTRYFHGAKLTSLLGVCLAISTFVLWKISLNMECYILCAQQ